VVIGTVMATDHTPGIQPSLLALEWHINPCYRTLTRRNLLNPAKASAELVTSLHLNNS